MSFFRNDDKRDGKPGVYFFSLDAASLLAVRMARALYHLPYFHANMKTEEHGGEIVYVNPPAIPPSTELIDAEYALNEGGGGSLKNGKLFFDMTSAPGEDAIDGIKVDQQGNVFCTGPGGLWVCRPDGALLGRIVLPELPANLAWGEDGSVLFLTARTSVYRLATKTHGELLV